MDESTIQKRMENIEKKIDVILDEVEAQRRLRNEISDLREDLMRVSNDVFRDTIYELEELSETLNTGDMLLLSKKFLRNVNNIKTAFEQLESARDFIADFNKISGDAFRSFLVKLDELDRKGYFELLRESEKTLDTLVASFSAEDLRTLNESLPMIVNILKKLSNPELIRKLNIAVSVFDKYEFDDKSRVSTIKLIREMNDPRVKKGMLFMLGLFKNVVSEFEIN
ncbi:MAG: hypothetical protein JXB48_23885 [Candidatus Latescibacteria bacterium]|nr:hypothetical protein [Candidatus Latescibacterota bacterium]